MAIGEKIRQLPIELWEKILLNIHEPLEILKCTEVNPVWKSVFANKIPGIYIRLTLPWIIKYLNDEDLLTCCLVNHDWNKAVDNAVYKARKGIVGYSRPRIFPLFDSIFQDSNDIADFIDAIDPIETGKPINLLPYRNISIGWVWDDNEDGEIEDVEDLFQYLEKLCNFFGNYGSFVTHLNLVFGNSFSYIQMIETLQRLITTTNNLLSLIINFKRGDTVGLDENENLKLFVDGLILPDLAHFTFLGIGLCPMAIVNALFCRYKQQLRTYSGINIYGLTFTLNYKRSDKMLIELFTGFRSNENIEYLESFLTYHKCQLNFMAIVIHDDFENCSNKFVEFITTQNSVETLYIDVKQDSVDLTNTLQGLNLPTVKIFSFKSFVFPTVQFIKDAMPGLEGLLLEYSGNGKIKQVGNIKMYKRLYKEKQFWKFLPSLSGVKITVTSLKPKDGESEQNQKSKQYEFVYTRDEYKEIKNARTCTGCNSLKCVIT